MSAEEDAGGRVGDDGVGARGRRRGGDVGRAIVAGMKRGEPGAFRAFVERYQRLLLHYARRAGIRGADADELVSTVIGDAAVSLLQEGTRAPGDVALYVIGAFRHRLFYEQRGEERRERLVRESLVEPAGEGDEPVALCSESALRASQGLEWEPAPPAAGLSYLSRMLSASLSDDERRMLTWESEDVPQREIAERLGISHAAARQRLKRLKERLRATAERYAAGLEGDSGRVVRRFLRRSLDAPRAATPRAPTTVGGGARQRRAEPAPLADDAGHETRGGPAHE